MSIIKKPVIVGICLVAICLFVLAWCFNNLNFTGESNRFDLNKNEIESISISAPFLYPTVETTDKDEISNVIDYFSSLTTTETKKKPRDYAGGGYDIKIKMKNGKERIFSHSGNMFFSEIEKGEFKYEAKFTYEIPYDQAIKFGTIFANISENAQRKRGEPSITGVIISLNTASNGQDISCVIKDKDNKAHDIFVQDADIIDATGTGWIILHEKDVINIFYINDKKTDTGSIIATIVYIFKSEYKP